MSISSDQIRDYLRLAYDVAAKSPDRSNQNGAVIIDNLGSIAAGCNTFTPGITWTEKQLENRDWKLQYIEHAERSAIFEYTKSAVRTSYPIMICPWFACAECARAIVLSGIIKVIGHRERMDMTPERWLKSVEAGREILVKSGVTLSYHSGKIGGDPIIVNGETWQP